MIVHINDGSHILFSAKVITTRMSSLRNHFQRMHRVAKSGSEPQGSTDRQREILRLVHFLRRHIKTSATLTTYRGVSPTPSEHDEEDIGVDGPIISSTPRRKPSKKVIVTMLVYMYELNEIYYNISSTVCIS